MGSIHRVSPDPPSAREQPASERSDARRGVADASHHLPDQNKNMQSGNVTAADKVSDERKKPATDLRQAESPRVRRRGSHLDKHA